MKRAFQKRTGRTENLLSIIILAVLVITAGVIYLRQFRINPAVIALRPESQPSASPAGERALIDTSGSDWVPFSPPERFGPETLYEKINGRADLYLSSGFVSLKAQRFTLPGTSDWIEVFIYDMQTPDNAFSVYSMQRREAATADDCLPVAYRTENALFAVHGRYYLELIGTSADEALNPAMGTLARLFADRHGGAPAARAPGAELFPAGGLDPATRQLITANAFGYEMLDHVHVAEYVLDGTRLTVFVSDRKEPEAASALSASYTRTLVAYGASVVDAPPPVPGAAVLKVFDTYEIVFSQGPYLAGIHETDDPEKARTLARHLADHLHKLTAG